MGKEVGLLKHSGLFSFTTNESPPSHSHILIGVTHYRTSLSDICLSVIILTLPKYKQCNSLKSVISFKIHSLLKNYLC